MPTSLAHSLSTYKHTIPCFPIIIHSSTPMASFSFIIGLIGNVISILVFASPIKTFWGVVKKKSTEDYKGLPYIATLLSTSLWSFYGIIKPGGLLVLTVNGAGALLQLSYVTLFLIYAPKKNKMNLVKLIALMDVGFLGAVIAISLLAFHGSMRITFTGVICAGFTLGMYGAPLSIMRTVIRTQSVEFMPFSLSFFLFLNGGIWSAYAALVRDYFIGVPNVIGFVLGSIQLIVYAIYNYKAEAAHEKGKMMSEEGSVHIEIVSSHDHHHHNANMKTKTVLEKISNTNSSLSSNGMEKAGK